MASINMNILPFTTLPRSLPPPPPPPPILHVTPPQYPRSKTPPPPPPISLNPKPHQVFDKSPEWDTLAWNTLIHTHLSNNHFPLAISTFTQMLRHAVPLHPLTLPSLLHASRLAADFSLGKQLHTHAVKLALSSRAHTLIALIHLYASLDDIAVAQTLFDKTAPFGSDCWTFLAKLYVLEGMPRSALELFHRMVGQGAVAGAAALSTACGACGMMGSLRQGRDVHLIAVKLGLEGEVFASNSLLKMYVDCGSMRDARLVFEKMPCKDVVSWTSMIRGCVQNGELSEAMELFRRMNLEGLSVKPDLVMVSTVLPVCGMIGSLKHGREIHGYLVRNGVECDVLLSNTLLKMYADCGASRDARLVFEQMPSKTVVSWTSMIRGYVKKGGFNNEVFRLFRKMNSEGLKPTAVSISSILPACGRIASHKHGREIHGYLLRNGVEFDINVSNAVIDMYVKSGAIACALNVFGEMNEKDTISWSMMIFGCSLHGQGKLGVDLFRQLERNSEAPLDDNIYAAALHACSTARMFEEGRVCFNHIRGPMIAHCAQKVSLLARCGLFDEAMVFIREQKIEQHPEVLRKLLEGCRIHGEYALGKQVIEQLCELEPLNAENYVLLLNWHAGKGKLDMVDKIRETIREKGLKPKKAYTWTLYREKVHVFGTGDVSHPRKKEICSALQGFMEEMRTEGVEPKWDFSLHDVDEERECTQIEHSELLALAFGLISSQAGPIRLEKNSRVCRGCHDFAKFVSKVTGREIILKDPNFFHHFKHGHCTCEDFW
ncbi:putative pentatricopeptide repeat-containing protein At3g23330 [Lotus japonicus]|uniref:putative pentatricopeptide repeat-containing protein At3g23330 n=1 Tax=Lotus japonicus TaxID=34305 RepID=UPI002588D37C|nr:putative pentatricopeptide repeat-containing protein At3g23330 [Lotus japonicus]XP_057433018.1 putative pentatricopeptide repeat-containing protein At3g23330 [Lotus japonicus]